MIRLPLWPSSAERWLVCSGQPRIAAIAAGSPREDNKFSGEGKAAHAYLSHLLTGEHVEDPQLPEDQQEIVRSVAEEVKVYAEVGGFDVLSEAKFTLDLGVHQMNLYVDIVLINEDRLIILDYKHGEGVPVNTEGNPQLLLYLIAAMHQYPSPRRTQIGIIQPRGMGEGWQLSEVDGTETTAFVYRVREAVDRAYAPEVSYVHGPHCRFCPGTRNPICPAILTDAIDAVAEGYTVDEEELTSWWLLDHLDGLKKVVKGVDTAANTWLKGGRRIPGWTLEEVDGRRVWAEPEEVPAMLAELLGGEEHKYVKVTEKPITLTEATQIAKRKGVDISTLIRKSTTLKRVKGNTQSIAMDAIE